MTFRLAYNPADTPVIVDKDGRSIGGQTFAALDEDAPLVSAAVENGRLLFPDVEKVEKDSPAAEAMADVKRLNAGEPDPDPQVITDPSAKPTPAKRS